MYVYTLGQWLLFFFLYCFLGWVWESCYVSLCQRRWVNRGFLHGPLLPFTASGPFSSSLSRCRWKTICGWCGFWACWPPQRWNMWWAPPWSGYFRSATGTIPNTASTSMAISA